MYYPGNYGFIPQTLGDDGDPLDIIVVGQVPVVPAAVIACRPIGVLIMQDEKGGDEKILAVPADDLHPFYKGVRSYPICRPSSTSRSRTFSRTTRIWSRASGSRSRNGTGRSAPRS